MLYDEEREFELLGAMLTQPAVIPAVIREVEAEDFGHTPTRRIFAAICALFSRGAVPDAFLVRDELADPELALQVLNATRDATVIPANARFHAKRIRALAMLRQLQSLSADFADLDPTDDPAVVIARATEKLRAAGADVPGAHVGPAELVEQAETDIDEHHNSERIVRTGLPTLDRRLGGGLVPQRLYVLGAKTSVGKSALATNITRLALDAAQRVLFISLEMTGSEVLTRLVAEKYDLDHGDIARLIEGWNSPEVLAWPLHFIGFANIVSLSAAARELRPQGLRLIVVDYIQLLPSMGNFERRDLEIGYMTRALKLLAVELEVPVLMLSQVNRQVNEDAPPQLHHLRESGNLEQDANVVMLLHRLANHHSKRFEAVLSVAKNRHGSGGPIELRYVPQRTRFRELSHLGVA